MKDDVVEIWKSSHESFFKISDFFLDKFLPGIIILVIGFLIGIGVEKFFFKIGKKIRMSHFFKKTGFENLLSRAKIKTDPLQIVGKFLKGVVFTFFLLQFSKILGFSEIEEFLQKIINWIPNLIIAIGIILFSIQFSRTVVVILEGVFKFSDKKTAKILAAAAKNIVIAFGILAAIWQLRIAADLIQILFTAFVSMLALAGGLSIGLGSKDFVRNVLEDLKNKSKK